MISVYCCLQLILEQVGTRTIMDGWSPTATLAHIYLTILNTSLSFFASTVTLRTHKVSSCPLVHLYTPLVLNTLVS